MSLEERVEFGTAQQKLSADDDFQLNENAEGFAKYDLACGQNKKEGYIGIDKVKTEKIDIVHDLLTFPWPIDDESVYEFHCEHFVEHIPIYLFDGSCGLIRFMEEVYRCLMPKGYLKVIAPHYMSMEAWQDPTHCRAITERTFLYFDKELVGKHGLDHYTGQCNFKQISKISKVNDPEWKGKSEEALNWARKHYWNVVNEIEFLLQKVDL